MIEGLHAHSLSLIELSDGYSNLLEHREVIENGISSAKLQGNKRKEKRYLKDLKIVNVKIDTAKNYIEELLVSLGKVIENERKNV